MQGRLIAAADVTTSPRRYGPLDVVKRAADVAGAGAALVLLFPLLAAIAVLVTIAMGQPVFFVQERPGLHGRPFRLVKFRTMRQGDETDAARLTDLGRLLRRFSLDELPQLWNVFRGDMSLVGPRPLLMEYLDRYTPEQARRHDVKPGITGLAQVNGRNEIGWEQRFVLDVCYIDHQSLWLDFQILLLTSWQVIARRGISYPGHVTMAEFLGSPGRQTRET